MILLRDMRVNNSLSCFGLIRSGPVSSPVPTVTKFRICVYAKKAVSSFPNLRVIGVFYFFQIACQAIIDKWNTTRFDRFGGSGLE